MGKIGQKRESHVVPDTVRKSSTQEVSLGAYSGQSEEGFLWFKNIYFNNSIPSSTFLQKQKTWGLGRISIITTFIQEGNALCTESIFLVLEITLTNSILQSSRLQQLLLSTGASTLCHLVCVLQALLKLKQSFQQGCYWLQSCRFISLLLCGWPEAEGVAQKLTFFLPGEFPLSLKL